MCDLWSTETTRLFLNSFDEKVLVVRGRVEFGTLLKFPNQGVVGLHHAFWQVKA